MKFQDLKYWREKASHYSPEARLFIDGKYCVAANNETFITLDPAGQRPLAKIARGRKADVDRAVTAARTVFERGDWPQASPAERKAILYRLAGLMGQHHEELALLEMLDTGKPIRHSLCDDIPGAVRAVRWYAEAIDKVYGGVITTLVNNLALIVREPVGVIVAIVPWNLPLLLACWKLDPALAAGSGVILEPSEKSPLIATRLAALVKKTGLPDNILSVVSGYGHEAGQALSQHPDVDVITLTGSIRTGEQLPKDAGDSNMKRVWLEAGDESVNIVFVDCPNLPKVVASAVAGIFCNQGQVCIASTRLLLEENIADEFIALLKERAKNRQLGNPLDPEATIGTLTGSAHADTVHGFTRDGEA